MLTNSFAYSHSLTHWCLQSSITRQWTRLQAWFYHCSTSLCPKMYQPQDVQCTYHELTFVLFCVLVLFTDSARCQFAIAWYGFPQAVHAFRPYFLYQVYSSYCCVTDEAYSVAKTKCNGPPHSQLVIDYWAISGAILSFKVDDKV